MQADRSYIGTTVAVLTLLAILGVTMRRLYFENGSPPQADSSSGDLGPAGQAGSHPRPILSVMDLTRTPAQTQVVLAFLLLVPVGLLVTALARSVVGIHTIGTFSPTLLALSQARSDWRIGAVIFAVTFGLGSLCRMMLARFRLSTVPRRGVIGTFVVIALTVAISLSHSYGLATTARHILLPIAVMTIMIERFFSIMEKEGNRRALTVLANSIAVAICCFMIFAYTQTGQILVRFPELELLIMAVLILLGRYSGRSLLNAIGLLESGKPEQQDTE
ncbi:MAG: hypothetical protein AMJ65_01595 [Phycisphaerae bacterium SG8_4]|nr:MAG: hypothetical protein AMJ65_01595 [Phycisphaerae bacterium SG8_4]